MKLSPPYYYKILSPMLDSSVDVVNLNLKTQLHCSNKNIATHTISGNKSFESPILGASSASH